MIEDTLQENEKALDDYLSGKEKAFEYLLGQLLKKTRGRIPADHLREALRENLRHK